MLGSHNSIFDSPSFIQKIMKKKSSNKYNIRPLYTADIVAEVGPWKKQINAATKAATSYTFNQPRKTKTYNQPSLYTQPAAAAPTLTPSISSTTTSSLLSDSTILMPIPSSSTPISQHKQQSQRKRPLSSEILIKIMDQRLLKKQQQQQKVHEDMLRLQSSSLGLPQLHRSVSSSTTNSTTTPRLKNKLLSNNKPTLSASTSTTTLRRNSVTRQNNSASTMRRHHQPQTQHNKKLKTSKSVLNKLNHHHTHSQQMIMDWPYVLTQDNDEQDRMVAQHYLLRTAFGSDFSSPIKTMLQKGIVVLDVGCGPGTWTMEMSTAFPKSTFIGIDQSAFYPQDIKPRNCHFRTCGSLVQHQLPLPFPDNSIDYIYQRDLNWGLNGQTWQPLLQEYQRILKPGGWIEFVEPDLETQNSLENECSMNDKLISGLSMRQQDPYAVHRLPTMLSINGFRRVEDFSQSFPLGWGSSHSNSTTTTINSSILEEEEEEEEEEDEDEEEQEILNHSRSLSDATTTTTTEEETHTTTLPRPHCSEFARAMSSQYLFLLKSLRPWLSTVMNLSYEKYDDYIAGLPAEWTRAQTYINWHCIIAQKPFHSSS